MKGPVQCLNTTTLMQVVEQMYNQRLTETDIRTDFGTVNVTLTAPPIPVARETIEAAIRYIEATSGAGDVSPVGDWKFLYSLRAARDRA